jgi:hypothetical protein
MEYRPLGRTELQVSAIGFGCWEIGGGYGQVGETEFVRAVGMALDLGVNCFDTAEGYGFGASERGPWAGAGPASRGRGPGHQVRDGISGQAEPAGQQPGTCEVDCDRAKLAPTSTVRGWETLPAMVR